MNGRHERNVLEEAFQEYLRGKPPGMDPDGGIMGCEMTFSFGSARCGLGRPDGQRITLLVGTRTETLAEVTLTDAEWAHICDKVGMIIESRKETA